MSGTSPVPRDVTIPRDPEGARRAVAEVVAQQPFARLMGYKLVDAADLAVSYRGPFDDHPDVAFATRSFCADALRDVLGAPSSALAKSH